MQNKFISLYANCLPIKGANRSVICDLQRGSILFVPNSLADIFLENVFINKLEFERQLDKDDIPIFSDYISLLEANEMIFFCSKKEINYFPKLSMEWDFPSLASNIIIDLNKKSKIDFSDLILQQLDKIGCRYIQLRSFDTMPITLWNKLNDIIKKSEVKSIELIVKDNIDNKTHCRIKEILKENKKIKSVILHSSDNARQFNNGNSHEGIFITVKEEINSSTHCGNIHFSFFSINVNTYTESVSHNSCLNRKIAIDIDGYIKNCPSMKESFGNIKDTTLEEAINKPGFKKYWNIKKDEITKCKDCEFRHVCTDCRAYIDNPDDIYSAPLKCGYNPYTCEWEEWSTNPLKQKAIAHYEMGELVKNEK